MKTTLAKVLRELGRILLPAPIGEVLGPQTAGLGEAHLGSLGDWGSDVARVLLAGVGLALGLLVLAVIITWLLAARVRPDPKAIFFAIFEERIRAAFPSQSPASLSTVLTGVNSILRTTPESPCVLLLVSSPRADATALRVARAVAEAVQAVLVSWPSMSRPGELELLGRSFAAADDYWHLYESLSRCLDEHRVAIIRDLQAIHPRAAAAITHLCDDAFPPFPQSVLLLLLSPGDLFPADVPECPGPVDAVVVAERCLVDCWLARGPPTSSGARPPTWASQEVLPSVLGRLTGRAVLVSPEPLDLPPEPMEPPGPPEPRAHDESLRMEAALA